MTEEEHAFGKALMGIIALVLCGLLIGFSMLGEKTIPINYMDAVPSEKTKNIS
tara:strand:- start:414 stop:572 length:159 start_codon:yes stop_codon:yes gene_type:complete